jgi:hypothetical protein
MGAGSKGQERASDQRERVISYVRFRGSRLRAAGVWSEPVSKLCGRTPCVGHMVAVTIPYLHHPWDVNTSDRKLCARGFVSADAPYGGHAAVVRSGVRRR